MKRLAAMIMVLVIMATVAVAETDLTKLTDDELLELEKAVREEKVTRGIVGSALISDGEYSVGEDGDIKAGAYIFTFVSVEEYNRYVDGYAIGIDVRASSNLQLKMEMLVYKPDGQIPSVRLVLNDGYRVNIISNSAAVVRITRAEKVLLE